MSPKFQVIWDVTSRRMINIRHRSVEPFVFIFMFKQSKKSLTVDCEKEGTEFLRKYLKILTSRHGAKPEDPEI
jgi:hypothetical protein